ncbi:MAG: hypothetical protein QHJ73_16550, partial [Armatimonadota bacterium]|nr:hypothetical protein [Armatimonadota bacterium]
EDGIPVDVELSEDGLEADLLEWVKDPRVMIAGQPVPEGTVPEEPPARVAVTVRYEHRLAGTLGVYGDLRAIFPTDPEIIEVNLHYAGKTYTGWVNNNLNLTFDLGSLFDRLDLPLCGGLFYLSPRGRGQTTDYAVTYNPGDIDPLVAVSDERLSVLEAMRDEPETPQTSTFEIMRRLMEEHKRGVHFVTLFTEVNVVRRTDPYLIASILSAYACFSSVRAGYWAYDDKKLEQGIRKQKRRYVKA